MSRAGATPTPMANAAEITSAEGPGQDKRKVKKAVLPGGGRSWGESEEAYLVQTRHQKMPYKHIAAHLKKTELACRLHYHQLLRGGGRRKRSASLPSHSDYSPERLMSTTSHREDHITESPPSSFPRQREKLGPSYSMSGAHLFGAAEPGMSMKLPTVLPKPAPIAPPAPNEALPLRYATTLAGETSTHGPVHVDLARLRDIYNKHKNSFWTAIANEYGNAISPGVLEMAWKGGVCCPGPLLRTTSLPLTPIASPEALPRTGPSGATGRNRIKIASILATDEELREGR